MFTSGSDNSIALLDDTKTLLDYNVITGMSLFIVDTDTGSLAKQIEFSESTSEEIKYRMSDEDYNKRTDSARAFLAKLRKTRPELSIRKAPETKESDKCLTEMNNYQQKRDEILKELKVGLRCEVRSLANVRGEICWIGERNKMKGT